MIPLQQYPLSIFPFQFQANGGTQNQNGKKFHPLMLLQSSGGGRTGWDPSPLTPTLNSSHPGDEMCITLYCTVLYYRSRIECLLFMPKIQLKCVCGMVKN